MADGTTLAIFTLATRATEVITGSRSWDGYRARLTPGGAIFENEGCGSPVGPGRCVRQWKNGAALPEVPGRDLQVEGRFATFTNGQVFTRRDLIDGIDVSATAPGLVLPFDLAPNGTFVYRAASDLYVWDGSQAKKIGRASYARTDGTEVLYNSADVAGGLFLYDGSVTTQLSAYGVPYDYFSHDDVNNGWVVFKEEDTGGMNVWETISRRAPGAAAPERVLPLASDVRYQLMAAGPKGDFIYHRQMNNITDPRILRASHGYDSNAEVISRQGWATTGDQRLMVIGGRWHLLLGNQVLRLEPPRGEMSGDHRSDVLWRDTTTGQLELWSMYGAHPDLYPYLPAIPAPWTAQSEDFNGDGVADLLWRNPSTGQTSIWFMNRHVIGGTSLPNLPAFWQSYPGDFNGDSHGDLLLRNTNDGQVSMWLLRNGKIIDGGNLPSLPLPWKIHVGDFNADGRDDAMLQNPSTADDTIWFLDGRFIIGGQSLPQVGAPWLACIGDYDGDPHADILWRNPTTGEGSIWLMREGLVIDGGDLPKTAAHLVPFRGDFDGNGTTDLFWHAANATEATIMMMNGKTVVSTHVLQRSANHEVLNLGW